MANIRREVDSFVDFSFFIIKSKERDIVNDILKSALQVTYGLSRKEAIDRIDEAKEQGNLFELYECAILKLSMEMKDNV